MLADVRLYREALVRALDAYRELELLGAAAVGDAGLELLASAQPDVVLLEMAAACERTIVHAILPVAPDARVVAYATTDEEHDAIRCVEAGASGYVHREGSVDELVTTILRVVAGEFPCSPHVAALLARHLSELAGQQGTNGSHRPLLTRREQQILALIDAGLSNKEIARRLGIGVSTVKNHVHNILEKTQVSRRGQAAARLRPAWTPAIASRRSPTTTS